MKLTRTGRRGSSLIEFTLLGVPLLFLFTSVMACSIDMWQMYTLSYAVEQTARYAALHGSTCSSGSNTCTIARSDVATFFQKQAMALDASVTTMVINDGSGEVTCTPVSSCPSSTSRFPSVGHNSPVTPDLVTIKATYALVNPIFMFWPGGGAVHAARFTVGATSTEQVIF